MAMAEDKAFLSSSIENPISNGTKTIPPPAPKNPLTAPAAAPDNA